jgi:hypothetical protein
VLPRALRAQSAAAIRSFEEVTPFHGLSNPAHPIGMLVGVKLLLSPLWLGTSAASPSWRSLFVVVGALIRLGGLG